MHKRVLSLIICAISLLFLSGGLVHAQQRAGQPKARVLPNSPRLTELRVTGSTRFGADELAKVTGLQLGTDVADEQMKEGADHLAATGMFTDVTYSFVSSPDGTKVEYRLNDTETLLPAIFDNFVWMPREELLKQIGQRTPLFRGEVPNAGEMYQAVGAAVKTILAEKGLNGDVQSLPTASQLGGPVTGFTYKVQGISIPIQAIEYPGASAEMLPLLQKASGTQIGKDYADSRMKAFTGNELLPIYRSHGFLRAEVKGPQWQLLDAGTNAVSVRLAVEEGACYELAGVEWSGNSAFTAVELTNALKPELGKPLDLPKMEDTLRSLATVYRTKGYLAARLEPKPNLDDAARKVTVSVEVAEGDQYRMGSVSFEGLVEPALSKVRSRWKLNAGMPFDSSYFGLFMQGLSREFNLSRINVSGQPAVHHDSKTVDMTIKFQQR